MIIHQGHKQFLSCLYLVHTSKSICCTKYVLRLFRVGSKGRTWSLKPSSHSPEIRVLRSTKCSREIFWCRLNQGLLDTLKSVLYDVLALESSPQGKFQNGLVAHESGDWLKNTTFPGLTTRKHRNYKLLWTGVRSHLRMIKCIFLVRDLNRGSLF